MSSLFERSANTLFFQIAQQIAAILVGIELARALGPVGKGITAYAMIALSLVTMFFNGQNEAIAYQFGRRRIGLAAVHRAMLHIFAYAAPLCMLGLIALTGLGPSQHVLIATALALPFALYAQFATQFFLVIGRNQTANIQACLTIGVYALVAIPLLLWAHLDTTGTLIVWVGSQMVGAVWAGIKLAPYLRGTRSYKRDAHDADGAELSLEHEAVLREQWIFLSKAGFSSFASYLNLRIDVIIVSLMLGAAQLGLYTLAIATGELMWKFTQALVWSALGRIASETPERSAQLVAKITRNLLAVQLTIGIVIFFLAPKLIILVYGAQFAPSANALRVLLPGMIAYTIEGSIGYYFSVQHANPTFRLVVQSLSIVLCATISVATIRHFSIIGAAIATSTSYLCVVVIMSVLFLRTTKIPASELFLLQRSDIERYRRLFQAGMQLLRVTPDGQRERD